MTTGKYVGGFVFALVAVSACGEASASSPADDLEAFDLASVPPAQAGAALRKHQLPIYDRNYWALMGRLQALNVIPDDAKVTMFDPSTYFAHDGNKARLMGVKKDGRWRFFTNTETAATTGMPPRKVHLSARLL
jgi:hypothetical protein